MGIDNEATQRLVHELEVHQVELEMQNEELRRAQGELELSRNTYAELYDFAPVGYFTLDASGRIREVNLAGAEILGIPRRELAGKPFERFIAGAKGKKTFAAHLETVLRLQGIQRCEVGLTRKDGAVVHGKVQSVKMDTIEKDAPCILASFVDNTVGKKLETEIQDAREYAENIVETVREPLVVLNSDLKILTANHSFYEAFKVTPGETIGNFIYDLGNRQWDIPRLRILFEKILPQETVFNGYEVEHDFPDIGRKIILLNAREIFREKVGSHIILLAMEDVTERRRIEADLASAKLAAEKANLAKSEFLSSMSHELRTPLSAILGFAQLMESGAPPPTAAQTKSIDQILKAGWHLLELINQILDLALIESGKLSMSLEPVSLNEVLRECEAMIEPQAENAGIGVSYRLDGVPLFVMADRTRLKQVLINLLSNAIKYNRAGGTVTVESAATGADSVRVSVRDTGHGLTPEQLAQLFQPFNRLGREASSEEGTGIGLVVSKRLVESMGGAIGVESAAGTGSAFWIELEQTGEAHAAEAVCESIAASPAPGLQGHKPQATLLYVEDNPANLRLVEAIIARRPDIRLLSATDGRAGIDLARAALPDVILMDINLPGISGIEALGFLASDPETAHIPVVALSANAMPRDIEKGMAAGFFRYLTKPIKVGEFLATLDETIRHAIDQAAHRAKKGQA